VRPASFIPRLLYPPRKSPRYPLNRRLGGPLLNVLYENCKF